MKELTSEQLIHTKKIFNEVCKTNVPLSLFFKNNPAVAIDIKEYEMAGKEISKYLNGIFVRWNSQLNILLTDDVDLDVIDLKTLKPHPVKKLAEQIHKHAKELNKNIVVFESRGLFDYHITIY